MYFSQTPNSTEGRREQRRKKNVLGSRTHEREVKRRTNNQQGEMVERIVIGGQEREEEKAQRL